jgi:hypothetical protein
VDEMIASLETSEEDKDPEPPNKKDDDDEEDRQPYEELNDKEVEPELYRTCCKAWFVAAGIDEPSAQKREEEEDYLTYLDVSITAAEEKEQAKIEEEEVL